MPTVRSKILQPSLLLLIGAAIFSIGISWGLPSGAGDRFLFGQMPRWPGSLITALASQRNDAKSGADVDVNPAARGSVLNDSDSRRAEIVRRYRLFTYQPDEAITMMALASMKPSAGDFDPHLYQYGGLWIYPVGALIKILLHPAANQAYYLDHPAEFGKFYIVARAYSAAWGCVGACAVFLLLRQSAVSKSFSFGGGVLFCLLPVVMNAAHEAKPHLAGCVLVLLSAAAARYYATSGRRRWFCAVAILAGAAAGMILSAAVGLLVIPLAQLSRPSKTSTRVGWTAAGIALAGCVYFVSNPYVALHLLGDKSALLSNLNNSQAMYHASAPRSGLPNAIHLIAEGSSPLVLIGGCLGAIALIKRRLIATSGLLILICVSAIMFVQFVLLAAGKPGEYGRFALTLDVTLLLCALVAIDLALRHPLPRLFACSAITLSVACYSAPYLNGFMRDSSAEPRRNAAADLLERLHERGAHSLGVWNEPAPYLMPPVDLFTWKIVLLERDFDPSSGQQPADVLLRAIDHPGLQPSRGGPYQQMNTFERRDSWPALISWADKPIEIWVRRDLLH